MVAKLQQKAIDTLSPRDTHPELPLDPDAIHLGEYKWPLHFTPSAQAVVFAGGCLGTFARYEIQNALPDHTTQLPYGTLLINLTGAFLLGALLEHLVRRGPDEGRRQLVRLGAGTGFMGAFTTYSTLAVETSLLVRADHLEAAWAYAALSVAGGLVCCAAGIYFAGTRHKGTAKCRY